MFTEWAVISPLRDEAGVVTHYVSIQEDITEKKRKDTELEGYRHHLEELVASRTASVELVVGFACFAPLATPDDAVD